MTSTPDEERAGEIARDIIDKIVPKSGMCRDCADNDGVCPNDGTICDRLSYTTTAIAAALPAARREEREACLADIAIEEELDGEPTEEEFAGMRAAGFIETMRATVRSTKKSIASRINQRSAIAAAIRSPALADTGEGR